jgi:uncharacterized protein (DUF4213/DUF364 family)
MQILKHILETLPDGNVLEVRIGLNWTAVVVDASGERHCGLASTLQDESNHNHGRDVSQAGRLESFSGRELAGLCLSDLPTERSVGMAAINALLPHDPAAWFEENAEDLLTRCGAGRRVALVGHFPFVDRLRPRVGALQVLEMAPGPGDLPATAAPEVIPAADVVAITSMTFHNHTLEGLLALCAPGADVILLGPSTPLSPILYEYGVRALSGSVVTAIEPVLRLVSQGGNFRQVHKAGVRLVNMGLGELRDSFAAPNLP